jgi:hypothetical protein
MPALLSSGVPVMNSRRTKRFVLSLIALVGLLGVSSVFAVAARAASSSFELVFDGRHEPDPASPRGFWHVGPFRVSGAFCSSGNGLTLGVTGDSPANAEATRLLTCEDGSGSVTALVVPIDAEHSGSGIWRIVSGTGQYAQLRGRGTFASIRVGGDPTDHGSIVFRSTWTGVADLDDEAPAISISRASAAKLRRPKGLYRVAIAFSASDTPGNVVRYRITVTGGGSTVGGRAGETASGTTSVALRVRPRKGLRRIGLRISASDPLGNERTISRSLRLPV